MNKGGNMKRVILGIVVAVVLGVFALAPTVAANATDEGDYVTVAWEMPSWVSGTTPSWPQVYVTSVVTDTPNLNAVDGALQCGKFYQVDVYNNSQGTKDLIAGGFLNGSHDPFEDLVSGGWGVAYKLVRTVDCPVVVTIQDSIDHNDACGPNNLVVNAPGSAAGVAWASSTDAVSGKVTVTATALTGHVLTIDGETLTQSLMWEFEDSNEPCPVVTTNPPVVPPRLAETGVSLVGGWLALGAGGVLLLGASLRFIGQRLGGRFQ